MADGFSLYLMFLGILAELAPTYHTKKSLLFRLCLSIPIACLRIAYGAAYFDNVCRTYRYHSTIKSHAYYNCMKQLLIFSYNYCESDSVPYIYLCLPHENIFIRYCKEWTSFGFFLAENRDEQRCKGYHLPAHGICFRVINAKHLCNFSSVKLIIKIRPA